MDIILYIVFFKNNDNVMQGDKMANEEEIEKFLEKQTTELMEFLDQPGIVGLGEKVTTKFAFVKTLNEPIVIQTEYSVSRAKGNFLYTGEKPTENDWGHIIQLVTKRKDMATFLPELETLKKSGRAGGKAANFQRRFNLLMEENNLPWRITVGEGENYFSYVINTLK